MPSGEIIAIGTELLLGEIQDTNTAYLARVFRDLGIDLFRTSIVGDNYERISQSIREAMTRSQIILTTGGLGPTQDDPTRQAIAHAVNVELEYRPDLWEQIQERFLRYGRQPTVNNRKQAYIPASAVVIENPVGTAPAFYFATDSHLIISLPGVPREMETIIQRSVIPLLRHNYDLNEIIKAYVVRAAGVGESQVDEWISDLENQKNPTVGLSAHPGIIDIRVTAKANSHELADKMIADTVGEIRRRVGVAIFGAQTDTLEQVLLNRLNAHNWQLSIVECGLQGAISNRLSLAGLPKERTYRLEQQCEPDALIENGAQFHQRTKAEISLTAGYYPGEIQQNLTLSLITPNGTHVVNRSYGGPPENGSFWAVNTALDFIRRNIP
jgi:nicotinamide-nucleotide amidase